MKRVIVERFGGPEVLRLVEGEDSRPGPGEVRVKVLAAGVSFTDSQLRAGTYIPGAPKPPFTPGYELVGVVEELGPRSEEHTSELQSLRHLVCRLLLEKKNKN